MPTIHRYKKPDYITRIIGRQSFGFLNLPAGTYKVYALKDGDGAKHTTRKKVFAFASEDITVSTTNNPVMLYASAIEKNAPIPAPANRSRKGLRFP